MISSAPFSPRATGGRARQASVPSIGGAGAGAHGEALTTSSTDQGGGKRRTEGLKRSALSRAAQRQNAPPATPETARSFLRALVVLAQQLSSSTSRAFVASPAHHFW